MALPFPFKKVATAIAFSPYAEANMHESTRIAKMLGAELVLIHVGAETPEKKEQLELLISQTEIDRARVNVEFREGDPVKSILASCAENNVDLLIAGAQKKENLLKFYTGSVARKLCRKAKCNILLLTDRSVIRNQCRQIIVSGDDHTKTAGTVRTANYFGKVLGANQITIVDEIDPKKAASSADDDHQLAQATQKRKEVKQKEGERLMDLEKQLKQDDSLPVSHKYIFGKPGYTIGHYAHSQKADLLVMNSPDTELGIIDRVFPHDLEYVLSDLPCCLMIVHQTTDKVA
ncbi:MAG: universal stress protein [Flavobacteriales bacterium]|nr:universal stress protein [Flavobacteriales bacterium]MCB9191281.1 universal stress protein [Flavobacteriales bacterium]MCB9204286.1 universal stress protein [Flavobacteriales bacterium]